MSIIFDGENRRNQYMLKAFLKWFFDDMYRRVASAALNRAFSPFARQSLTRSMGLRQFFGGFRAGAQCASGTGVSGILYSLHGLQRHQGWG